MQKIWENLTLVKNGWLKNWLKIGFQSNIDKLND